MTMSNAWWRDEPEEPVDGWAVFEWLDDTYVVWRWEIGEPPPAVCVIGYSDAQGHYQMLYHDDRGVARVFEMEFAGGKWTMLREDSDFYQRFEAQVFDDRIIGAWEASEDQGRTWRKDFDLSFERAPGKPTTHDIECWSPLKVWLYSLLNRSPKSNRAAVELASLTEDDRFLDIGCGLGAALGHAAASGAEVAGVDPSPSMVNRASRRVPQADIRVGSAETIPFPDHNFTVAINISSFHHWADREAGLKEILRVLAPGGRLHIVEGLLKEGKDGHGLSPNDAEVLAHKLLDLGYADTKVETLKTGWRHRYMVVSAVAPGSEGRTLRG